MAPLPHNIKTWQSPAASVHEHLVARLVLPAYNHIPDSLTEQQWLTLQSMSLAIAALSFASVGLTFYWFSRMRRSFRHDLIMLLISSDMLKSLWFIISPIVNLKTGMVASQSSFCQASGFFLSVGIEASDIAVLLIALHTAMYIFRPRQSAHHSGLYPYRRLAFSICASFPLLMASLAFVDKPGYVNNGNYCYLPVHPAWPRLALSWVPRYVILVIIVGLYACIYIYVTKRIRRFGRVSAMRRAIATQMSAERRWVVVPSVLASPTLRRESESSVEGPAPRRTSSSATTMTAEIELIHGRQKVTWNWPTYAAAADGQIPQPHEDHSPPRSPGFDTSPHGASYDPITPPPQSHLRRGTADYSPPPYHHLLHIRQHSHPASVGAYSQSPSSPTSARAKSLGSIWSILRRGSSLESDPEQNATPFLFSPAMDGTGMTKTRDKIRRQLRLLFIYPLVYILIWAVPFTVHVMRWDNPAKPAPFLLVLLSLGSLSIQGLVNSCLFCAVEKPWIDRRVRYRRTPSKTRGDKYENQRQTDSRPHVSSSP